MNRDSAWWRLVHLDPLVWRAAVVAVVTLAGALGIVIAPAVPDALVAVLVVVASIVTTVWQRPAVTANARVAVAVPDPVGASNKVIAGEAVTTATNVAIIDAARSLPRPS